MLADALASLGARSSSGMVLTPKPEYSVFSIWRVKHFSSLAPAISILGVISPNNYDDNYEINYLFCLYQAMTRCYDLRVFKQCYELRLQIATEFNATQHDKAMIRRCFPHHSLFLGREPTVHCWIPSQRAIIRSFDVFFIVKLHKPLKHIFEWLVIWDTLTLIWFLCNEISGGKI